jgi:type II secretory pathway predicted ATPase ExeA
MIDQLRSYYGFNKMPFGKSLTHDQLHHHNSQKEAMARLSWCVFERGIAILTGEVGAGKTVAARAVVESLDKTRHKIIYIGNPTMGQKGIYSAIVTALGDMPRFNRATLIPQTMDLLAAEENERGRQVILIVDEAHLLEFGQLEEIRLLTNADMDSRSALTVILIGQPTLRHQVKLGKFAALDQRILTRPHLEGMSKEDTKTYIAHHLKHAGAKNPLFADDAIDLIHHNSRGLPRGINNLAISALLATFFAQKDIVDKSAAEQAITEIGSDDKVIIG